ncbi:FAD/FMN-containing dehydrogenase [Inhella inkyongensis]|uniref:FAD/FMN-containing dehydrogenase n=1 Tax=Inhella inkyongensis TaxID=392593 RepID=A0A840S3F9_9BURK|nr:FAD-binding oxidoreductase [Inhella inkyongensis]MBB5203069.1 FAD/FMN-containing dehydrogenase [Inhella inkyongensis]
MSLDAFLKAAGALASTEVEPRYLQGARYGAGQAAALLKPGSVAEAAELLRLADAHGIALVLQGAHTGLVQAATPQGQVILSTERLREVFEFDPLDRTLRVSTGFKLSEVNQRLAEHGLQFPIDLSADPSIGGMLAHNTGGTRMCRYGDVRANTLGMEVLRADGQALRLGLGLAKDNSALALQHLFIGSSGALGLITEATLKLAPLPKQSAVALVAPADWDAVWPLYQRWTAAFGSLVSAFEGLSANALEAAIHVQGGASPFAEGLPPYSLLVELSADVPASQLDLRALLHTQLEADFESGAVVDAALDNDEGLWGLRHAVSEGLREQGAVIGFDISLPRRAFLPFRAQAGAWLAEHFAPAKVCDFGHLGDGGQHYNLVWPKDCPKPGAEDMARLREGIYALVAAHGGSFSAEHGLGPLLQATYDALTPSALRQSAGAVAAALNPSNRLGQFRFG